MTLGRNLLAGLANSVWSALIGLAVVPFYLKYLGIEAYGLIGFFVTTQAVLSLLDMGMAPTINREVARCSASGNLKEAGKLLHTLAVVYWCMAGAIALLILALAPLIAGYWLQSKQLSPQTISHAVMLMGLVVACRSPIGLYQGALIGAQRVTVSSGINMVMATLGSLGAVTVLAFVSPTIEAFFIWQACIGFAYALTIRAAAWRVIGRAEQFRFDTDKLKSVWRFTAGMSGVAISAVILMQLDKVLLSKMLSLEDFGRYALAGVVASGLYILLTPTFNVIYPRLSALVETGDMVKLVSFYRSGTRILGAILFPAAIAAAMSSKEILLLWTGNHSLASSTAPIVSMLLIGTTLNGIMHFPYALQMAFGLTRIPLIITVVLSIILVPLIVIFTSAYGAVGGAFAWIILNFMYLLFGTWLTHRHILKGMALEWLLRDVGVPLGVSLTVMFLGWMLLHESGGGIMNILLAMTLALISFSLCVSITLRSEVKMVLSKFW